MPSQLEKKIPGWAGIDGLQLPPALSMEQCSGQTAALYKARLVARWQAGGGIGRERMADLTGGFGVDFTHLAPLFRRATYVERNDGLCRTAAHNFPLLGLDAAQVVCAEADAVVPTLEGMDLVYLDPARRDGAGRKVLLVEDCTPDVSQLLPGLLRRSRAVLVKLSPMLDITRALRSLAAVPAEVHIVAVGGECKELLFAFGAGLAPDLPPGSRAHRIVCRDDRFTFAFRSDEEEAATVEYAAGVDSYLFEPGAAVMKAGAFRLVARRYGLAKLHPNTHLYTAGHAVDGFPGRQFRVKAVSSFGKRDVRGLLRAGDRANLAVRNFPGTVAELRKRFRLKDGGTDYWFATTLADGRHVIIVAEKAGAPVPA